MAKTPNVTRYYKRKYVQVRFLRGGKRWEENFFISKYGNSWEKAEQAAIARRDILAKEVPAPYRPRKGKMTKSNSSGVVGVNFLHRNAPSSNGTIHRYSFFAAYWQAGRKSAVISWTIKKHGFKNAFVLAVLSRRMESKDRAAVYAEFEEIQNTAEFTKIARLCKVKL